MFELLKVIVQPVVLERNEDGKIIGEKPAEPRALYDREQVIEFLDEVDQKVRELNTGIIVPTRGEDLNARRSDAHIGDHLR